MQLTWTGTRWKFRVRESDGSRPWLYVDLSVGKNDRVRAEEIEREETEKARGLRAEVRASGKLSGSSFRSWVERRWKSYRNQRRANVESDLQVLEARCFEVVGKDGLKFGDRDMREITAAHLEGLVLHLDRLVRDKKIRHTTARNNWNLIRAAFRDASRAKDPEVRVRKDNPTIGVAAPDKEMDRTRVFVYPSELLAFARCGLVPLRFRRLVVIAVYMFLRVGELEALRWDDLDLDHGTAHIHRSAVRRRKSAKDRASGRRHRPEGPTKGRATRRIAIEPALLPLLKAMRQESPDDEYVVGYISDRISAQLRRRFQRVVKRSELFESGVSWRQLCFHDTRATGITWCAVRGDDPIHIQWRAGHKSFDTTNGYIRAAEQLRSAFGDVFPELPPELLEEGVPRVSQTSADPCKTSCPEAVPDYRWESGASSARDSQVSAAQAEFGDSRNEQSGAWDGSRLPTPCPDTDGTTCPKTEVRDFAIEALSEAVRRAAEQNHWAVVMELSRQLDGLMNVVKGPAWDPGRADPKTTLRKLSV